MWAELNRPVAKGASFPGFRVTGNHFRDSGTAAREKLALESGESGDLRHRRFGPWPLTWTSHLPRCLSPRSWRTCCGTVSSWGPSSSSSACWPSLYLFPSPTRWRQSHLSPEVLRGRGSPRLLLLLQARGPRRRPRRSGRRGALWSWVGGPWPRRAALLESTSSSHSPPQTQGLRGLETPCDHRELPRL